MISTISTLGIGFSIGAVVLLIPIYTFFLDHSGKSRFTQSICGLFLVALACLQFEHLRFFMDGGNPLDAIYYRWLIFIVPPLFYFFSRAVLFPLQPLGILHGLHFFPCVLAWSISSSIAVPLAFLIGFGYCLWLTHIIVRLRPQKKRYGLELFFFSLFTLIAMIVLVLGFSISYIDIVYFYAFYANGISLVFCLVVGVLIIFPNVLEELHEAVTLGYTNSTLGSVDIAERLEVLEGLIVTQKLYQDESLNLASLATEMDLSSHQLSELINIHHGLSFSQYIKGQRIRAARERLLEDRKSSILSISMELGFKSQSSFYAAFKDLTGQSPGQYRKSPAE